jgi:Na+/H+ antiporter NhaD/arsenite permease-like protein
MMVLSAQLAAAGVYAHIARVLDAAQAGPKALLAWVVVVSGAMSAVLTNDVVCVALAPLVAEIARRRRYQPLPYLLALAAAANVGSALTLIGNPQNILLGQTLQLSFGAYAVQALVPVCLGLGLTWMVIWQAWKTRVQEPATPVVSSETAPQELPTWNRLQAVKGLTLLSLVMILFVATELPREAVALGAAAVALCSRRIHSQAFVTRVDWPLLVLFTSLFVVHAAFDAAGWTARLAQQLQSAHLPVDDLSTLYWLSVPLSNVVSNVPAVMLLLETGVPAALGPALALSSTLAGNLLLVGSIANLIVAEEAQRQGLSFTWKEHARVGVPIALSTLLIAWLWLVFLASH